MHALLYCEPAGRPALGGPGRPRLGWRRDSAPADIKEVRRASPVYSQTQLNSSGGPLWYKGGRSAFSGFFLFLWDRQAFRSSGGTFCFIRGSVLVNAEKWEAGRIWNPSGPHGKLDQGFTLDIQTRRQSAVTILDVCGRLTTGSGANLLVNTIRDLVREGRTRLVFNFESLEFMDSTGLGSLVTAAEQVRRHGGRVCILNAHDSVRHLLQITRLDSVLPNYQDENAALKSFAL